MLCHLLPQLSVPKGTILLFCPVLHQGGALRGGMKRRGRKADGQGEVEMSEMVRSWGTGQEARIGNEAFRSPAVRFPAIVKAWLGL